MIKNIIFIGILISIIIFTKNTYAQDLKDLNVTIGEACIREISGSGECVQSGGQIQITIKVDSMTINSVRVNKGNCQNFVETMGMKQFPKQAKFGDRIDMVVTCNPILVELDTDHGRYEYSAP